MQRFTIGAVACTLLATLAGCGMSPVTAPDGNGFTTKQYGGFGGIGAFGTGCGGTVQTAVAQESCVVPTVVNREVPVEVPVQSVQAVTTSVPVTRMVAVQDQVPVTQYVPTCTTVTQTASVPEVVNVQATRPVQYSQYCSGWVRQSDCGIGGYGGFGGIGAFGGYGGLGIGTLGYGGFGGCF